MADGNGYLRDYLTEVNRRISDVQSRSGEFLDRLEDFDKRLRSVESRVFLITTVGGIIWTFTVLVLSEMIRSNIP